MIRHRGMGLLTQMRLEQRDKKEFRQVVKPVAYFNCIQFSFVNGKEKSLSPGTKFKEKGKPRDFPLMQFCSFFQKIFFTLHFKSFKKIFLHLPLFVNMHL